MRTERTFIALTITMLVARTAGADEEPRCALAAAAGIDPIDAQTAADLVCSEVAATNPPPKAHYNVRLARLERKVVISLDADTRSSRLVLSGLDEVPTAAPRLVASLAEMKPVAETENVDNLIAEETRKPKRKPGDVHAWLGVGAVGFLGANSQMRGGAELGMSFGNATTSFVLDARLAGESFMAPVGAAAAVFTLSRDVDENRKKVPGAVGMGSVGIRQHTSKADIAPFGGVGLGIAYLSAETDKGPRASGTGVVPYLEAGLDVLRTSMVGGIIGARLDIPLFSLTNETAPTPGKQQVEVNVHFVLASMFIGARF
jgi:hypothetical protein